MGDRMVSEPRLWRCRVGRPVFARPPAWHRCAPRRIAWHPRGLDVRLRGGHAGDPRRYVDGAARLGCQTGEIGRVLRPLLGIPHLV